MQRVRNNARIIRGAQAIRNDTHGDICEL
jgi:hypothetical protein